VNAGRIGLVGASQASWIAALAGERLARNGTPPSFLIIRSGPLTTPAEEGSYDYEVRLRGAGFGEREIEEARALLRADDEVTRSGGGGERLRVLVDAAAGTAWFRAMEYAPEPGGSPGRIRFRPWLDLDPAPLLRQVPAPGLWLYGSADETVPALASLRIAEQLREAGKDYDIMVIAGADHALMRPNPGGGPWPVLAPEYLQQVRAWMCRRGIALAAACATPPRPGPASPT
jgi:pimeloyl-ACP methyl ester carboxylesterase